MQELFVLEWSKRQNCFHIQPAINTAEANLRAFMHDKEPADYHVLLVGTREQCDAAADRLRHKVIERERRTVPAALHFAHQ